VFSCFWLSCGVSSNKPVVYPPGSAWAELGKRDVATFLRVSVALAITLIWTIPVGVFIEPTGGLPDFFNQSCVVASIPASAFSRCVAGAVAAPGGLNIAAVLLMLMGTQWYLLFNVIAGQRPFPKTCSTPRICCVFHHSTAGGL
jgi:NitT/TauT family transport system permease protein